MIFVMSKNLSYIVALCEKLIAQKKQPSVALIKKLSNRPLPLPEVISVLRRWKEDPEKLPIPTDEDMSEPETASTPTQKITELEQRVIHLEQQLTELTDVLNKLTNNNN